MVDFKDKFRDRRWQEKEEEVLGRASHRCEEEGCESSSDLKAHICYWQQGVEPWDYPDEAYKCLCREHREVRKEVERSIRIALCHFAIEELDALERGLSTLCNVAAAERTRVLHQFYATARNAETPLPESEW